MKEHPIIFSAPMVRAILDGRKMQTRRLAWREPNYTSKVLAREIMPGELVDGRFLVPTFWQKAKPGDRLWVRETITRSGAMVAYVADGSVSKPGMLWPAEWKRDPVPSIHMPRWASRITLEVTAVRIERLQDMQGAVPWESDALLEGINKIHHGDGEFYYHHKRQQAHPENWVDPADAFHELWDSLHDKPGTRWDDNPWVVVISFRRTAD